METVIADNGQVAIFELGEIDWLRVMGDCNDRSNDICALTKAACIRELCPGANLNLIHTHPELG